MRKILEFMKTMYDKRDQNMVEPFYDMLFKEVETPMLLGTSNLEIYLEKEKIIKLFRSDLEDWGHLTLDLDQMSEDTFGDMVWVKLPATVQFDFENDEATYGRFVEFVNDIKKDTHGTLEQKALLIQNLLVHLLSDRDPGKRTYLWHVNINMLFNKKRCELLSFSMPVDEFVPDVRLDDFDPFSKYAYDKELGLIKSHVNPSVDQTLIDLIKSSVQSDKQADKVHLENDQMIIKTIGDDIMFFGVGSYEKKIALEERLKTIFEQETASNNPKQSLFELRRDIIQHVLHDRIGEVMHNHFRTFGMASKTNNGYAIQAIEIILPFNVILEEKKGSND